MSTAQVSITTRRRDVRGALFRVLLYVSVGLALVTLAVLVGAVVQDGAGWLSKTLLTAAPSVDPEIAGARPAILATIYIGILVLLFTVPLGVATALYLEEYAAKDRWYNRLLEVNIQNLAAVPSIVYGILGLAFIVRGIGLGRVLLAGAIILTLLTLPTVIIASREAVRAVPDSIRQGAYALGATQWQVVRRQVLPAAIPGIATGLDSRAFTGHWRDRAPAHDRRPDIRLVRSDATRPLHRVASTDLQLDPPATDGVQVSRRGCDHRPPCHHARDERPRDHHPQPLPEEVVTIADPIRLAEPAEHTPTKRREAVFQVSDLTVLYSGKPAVKGITMDVAKNEVTAIIGPSGCGKSTFIRCFNRMNDLIPGASVEGELLYHGLDLYGPKVDPVEVRKRIGMVFQKPNPFPKSIYDNVAFGPRVLGIKDDHLRAASSAPCSRPRCGTR